MKKLFSVCTALLCASGTLFADGNSATDPPVYNVNPASTAPVIDGVVSPGEWDAAADAAGDWVNLRAHTPDSHNLRFQAMWDENALYLLGYTGYNDFTEPRLENDPDPDETFELEEIGLANPSFGGATYNPNFYFDPNTDDEWEGVNAVQPNNRVDGYQIAWDVHEGFSSRRPTEVADGEDPQRLRDPLDENGVQVNDYYSGLFLEAHANNPFGNQGGPGSGWERTVPEELEFFDFRDFILPGLVFAQNASNTEDVDGDGTPGGGVWEFAISWDTFSATDPNKLVTQEEADSRGPEFVTDDREFIMVPDPEFPDEMIEVENPEFGMEVRNVGQFSGIAAWIGNAGDPDLRFAIPEDPENPDPAYIDHGLYAVDGPEPGDIWGFETSIITPDSSNFLPSWSEPLDGDASRNGFAPWGAVGHGRLVFMGGEVDPDPICDPTTGGDLDQNGVVEFADFLVLSGSFGQMVDSHTEGDIDCNGTVEFADFLTLSGNFGQSVAGAESIPEPSGIALLGFAGLAAGLLRRRR